MGRLKKILLVSATLLSSIVTLAATDTTLQLTQVKTINGDYASFYVDNLNNIYLVNHNNQVKKLDNNYDSVAVFNDTRRYGDIYSLDVSNPLKIIVYYRDFNTILILDRFLNVRNTIDLRKSGILQAKAVAQSYDNNYWIFDELDNKIKKIDDNGNILLESADFRVLFSEQYDPVQLIDNDGLLYLYDPKNGWLVFDYYGAFKQRVQVTGWSDVQVTGKNIMGHTGSFLYFANPKALDIQEVKTNINLQAVIKLQKAGNIFIALTKQGLSMYTL
ncbi:MAG TPA: hypothetical protein VG738_05780 [Chitinophagaceae bacterium]|nr:hypothetical protein [Chitinophagaceae bacterium]